MDVDVQIASSAEDVPSADMIRRWVEETLGEVAPERDGDVSVRIVDEQEMRTLNRNYRDQDKPTNVLSFPAGEVDGLPPGESSILGDIVICADVVEREATEQDKTAQDHWGHMIVHGTLHLLGYNHIAEPEAAEMEGLERKILAELGITDPYKGN